MKFILNYALCLSASLLINTAIQAQTPHLMSSGDYTENFADIANVTNWPNGFNGPSSSEWSGLAVNATGTIPDGVRITTATTTFITGGSGGVQRGTENIQLLSTGGNPGNTTSTAIELLLNFSGRSAGTLAFDAATVFNSTGDRFGTLRVYGSVDGASFVELTAANLPFIATNNVAGSAQITGVALPISFNNAASARLRFYYHNGPNGTTGSRPKISIDNVVVTSSPIGPVAPSITSHPGTTSIPINTGATLSVAATGTAPLTYQWYQGVSGDTSTPVGTDSPSFNTGNLSVTTSYWVRVTNSVTSVNSNTATVTVISFPFVTTTVPAAAATNVPINSVITLNFSQIVDVSAMAVTVTDGVTPVLFSGLPADDVNSVTLTPTVALAYGTTYTVSVASNEITPNLENVFTFSFTTLPPVAPLFTTQPASGIYTAGEPASLSVTVTGTPTPTLQWYQGLSGDTSNPLSGEQSATLNIASVAATSYYWVRATNIAGVVDSQTAILSVPTPGPFGEGNVVVNRVGDGVTAISAAAAPVDLLEVSPNGALAQVIATPFRGDNLLTQGGNAGTTGFLNSLGDALAVPGLNLAAGTASANTQNAKVVHMLGVGTTLNSRTLFPTDTTLFGGDNLRSVVPDGFGGFYATGTGSGSSGGVWRYDGSTFTRITATGGQNNTRNVGIFGGQLFFSTGSGTQGIYSIGSGLPTTASAASLVIGITNPYAFYFASTGAQGQGVLDRAWVASDATGLVRFDFNGSSWVEVYARRFPAIGSELAAATGEQVRGITGHWNTTTGTATLYLTTNAATNNRLVKVIDSGTTPITFTTLQTAGANYVFRGVANAPKITPPALISTLPLAAATGVSRSAAITLNFNKPVNLTGGAITIEAPAGATVTFFGLPTTGPVSSVVLTPSAPLPFGTLVSVRLTASQITDTNALAMAADTSFTFTTETAITPVVNVTPTSLEVPINTVATLTAAVTAGSAPVTLQWYEGDASNLGAATLLTGQTGTALEVTQATVATRSFFVRATNAAGESVNSNTVPISFTNFVIVTATTPANGATGVLPDSGITITFSKGVKLQPGAVTLSPDVPFTLSPGFNAADFATTYVLTPNSPLAMSTLHTVTVNSAQVTDVDALGMQANFPFTFTTLVPVAIATEPQPQSINHNGTAVFTVVASGDGPLSYDWRRNGVSLGAPNSPTLTLTNVQPGQAGNYSVVVTGPGTVNTATSVNAALTVTFPSVTLTGTSYTQDFNTLGSGLPLGWSVYTAAAAASLGTPATLVTSSESASAWAQAFGNFRNVAAVADLPSNAAAATQFASANRALGVRQIGAFGDPGASFNIAINSTGKNLTGLSFKAQILDSQPRSTAWSIQVGVGLSPSTWETIGVFADPGAFGSTNVTFGEAALASLANQPLVWVRIVALTSSTGSGARDTFGIDDFVLTYEDEVAPLAWDSNGSTLGAGGPSPAGTWGLDAFWSASAAGDGATAAWVPGSKAAFSAGADATGPFTVTIDGEQEARSVIIEEGTVTLTGGTLRLTGSAPRLQVLSESATIASLITGSAGFIKVGPGLLTLTNTNTFTGAVTLGAGTLEISSDAALGDSTNDVTLGGTLRITQSMTLGVDRNLSGAGTIQLLNAADLVIGGNVNAFGVGLVGPGSVAFSGAMNGVGNFTLGSSVELTGNALTLTNLTATAGSSTIANPLVFSPTVATVAVEAGGALRLDGAITMGNLLVTDRLIKTGEGTLELPVANPNLYKIALGVQGVVPVSGGLIKVGNKSALGTSLSFLNFGTVEFTQPLTGANALDIGFSISGREGSPIQLTGEAVTVLGTNNIYGTVGTTGSVVVLKANNHTTFNGSFIVDPTTVVPVNTLKVGGTGSVTIASPSFPISLIVSETVSVEFNSDGIASSSAAASGLLVESGATLHPGTEGGARVVAVSKNFTLQSGGKVVFDITGSAAGQFDALNFVSSDAAITVDGSIEVRFGSGYVPQAGHQFQILQFLSGAAVDLADVTLSLPVLTAPLSWNTTLFATTGLLVIDGPGAGLVPVITFQPQSVLDAFASDLVSFAVTAVGAAPLSYQWLYYGQPINNATNRTLTLTASTANAGVYRVRVSNSHGSVISAPAFLAVNGLPVITEQPQKVIAAEGVSTSFTFRSIGTVTGIQWQFNSGTGFANVVGEVSATLNRTAGAATYGSYRVVLTNSNGTVTSFAASLEAPYTGPPTSRPEWDYSGDLPPGQVGVVYAFTPGIKPDEPLNSIYRSAARFTATGLPTGLSINPTTGEISGTPVAVKATPYVVVITARNVTGTAVLSTRILINPLPTGALGVFTGPIQRSAILDSVITGNNGALGGQFDMVVTPTSVVSGKVTIGARAFTFRGVRATIPTAPLNRLSVAATIRVNATVNLTVSLLVNTLTGTILDTSTISDGTTTVAFKGWRNPWGTRAPAVQATALAGLYTTKLDLADTALNSSQAPVGAGFLSFTVAPTTGRLTLSGRLSDGSAITMATFVGPAGQILLFRPLYASTVRGSVLGELGIAAEANPIDNTVEGDLSWTRPANAAASNRLYKTGFPAPGMLAVKVEGARYVPPTPRTARNLLAEPRVMGLTDAANEIEVLLTGAGIATAEPLQPNTKANVALNNRVTFSLDPLINTRKMTLAFNAARGTFTGKVTLKQNNPLLEMAVPPLLVSVTRAVTYQGLIVKGEGAGYFILAQLPMIAGDTPTKTAMESGKVEIKAVPVVP